MHFEHYIPTRILFGPGKLNELSKIKLPGKKALIVISSGTSMRKNGYLERVIELLKKNKVESIVFDKILPNPINKHVMEGAALAKSSGCDFIIGLGGGSSLDSAKSIAVMVNNPGNYWDYIGSGSGKGLPINKPVLPIVAITTTAGTGSEADPWTVITHEERNEKIGFGNDSTFPVLSIVDPELMLTVPPALTAYQGFDAFFHAAEGVIANIASPESDMYALKSIELISKYLPTAVNNGLNLEARSNIAMANTLSGFTESTSSCTSEHSLEHAMSAYHPELQHGAGLIIISIAYFSLFAEYAPERFILMAKAMGKNTNEASEDKKPLLFIEALKELQKKCGVDNLRMSDYGITETEFDKFADNAVKTMGGLFTLDRHKLTHQEIVQIYKDSYK